MPLVPMPTVTLNVPPEPAVAASEPRLTHPLLLALEPPELKTRWPLAPAVPAFGVAICISPLLDAALSPLATTK